MKLTGYSLALAVLLTACQGGEVMGTATTDYGIAIATAERTVPGDVDSMLTSKDGKQLFGELTWDSTSHELTATIATATLAGDELDLSGRSLEQFNELLFRLWEVEVTNPTSTVCLDDGQVICCRDSGWHCGYSQLAP